MGIYLSKKSLPWLRGPSNPSGRELSRFPDTETVNLKGFLLARDRQKRWEFPCHWRKCTSPNHWIYYWVSFSCTWIPGYSLSSIWTSNEPCVNINVWAGLIDCKQKHQKSISELFMNLTGNTLASILIAIDFLRRP